MGAETGSLCTTYAQNPDVATATQLIDTIAARHVQLFPRTIDKPLVLYGAGNLGRLAKAYLDICGIPVSCVADAQAHLARRDPFWEGVHIAYPFEISELDKETCLVAVCIVTTPYDPIRCQLAEQGWQDIVPFYDIAEAYRDRHPLANGWFAGSLTPGGLSAMQEVASGWNDDSSRAHHLQFLAWRRLREEWVFPEAPITIDDRYFIPQLFSMLHAGESFLDIGAHFGEASIRFAQAVRGTFQHITAIEPDPDNMVHLKDAFSKTFTDNQLSRVTLMDQVLDEQAGICRFCDGLDYASQISPLGNRQTPVKTLDELVLEPSFIKLHLEGRELAVLKGGRETLRRSRPIIATTAYHNHEGLWELPLWLMQNLQDYRFLLRLHGWCGTGLVIYALPAERYQNDMNQQKRNDHASARE
jgi:FkbM family methyltransferase